MSIPNSPSWMKEGAATAPKKTSWDRFDEGLTAAVAIVWGMAQFICTAVVLLAIALEKYDAATAFGVLVLILRPPPSKATGGEV